MPLCHTITAAPARRRGDAMQGGNRDPCLDPVSERVIRFHGRFTPAPSPEQRVTEGRARARRETTQRNHSRDIRWCRNLLAREGRSVRDYDDAS